MCVMRTCDGSTHAKGITGGVGGGGAAAPSMGVCLPHSSSYGLGKSPLPHLLIESPECWNASAQKVSLPS